MSTENVATLKLIILPKILNTCCLSLVTKKRDVEESESKLCDVIDGRPLRIVEEESE